MNSFQVPACSGLDDGAIIGVHRQYAVAVGKVDPHQRHEIIAPGRDVLADLAFRVSGKRKFGLLGWGQHFALANHRVQSPYSGETPVKNRMTRPEIANTRRNGTTKSPA